jgi:hypothetical protein
MKRRWAVGLCVTTVSSLALGGWLGCGSSGSSGPTPDASTGDAPGGDSGAGPDTSPGDTGVGTDTSVIEGGGDTGTPGDTGAGDTGAADAGADTGLAWDGSTALNCTDYCGLVMSTCTGMYAQYQTAQECMNACALLPLGMATDTSGDSIGCRIYHVGLAMDAGLNPHCWHAGPYGFGGCGTNCEAFCTLALGWCSAAGGFEGGTDPYTNAGQCTNPGMGCPSFALADGGAYPGAYSAAGPQSGNTLDCREWHLGKALTDQADQQIHCLHVGAAAIGSNPFPCQ